MEPEIVDLADCLIAMGAQDRGRGHRRGSWSQGVERLHGGTHAVVADRIETGTFLVAAAMTGGRITAHARAPGHDGRGARQAARGRRATIDIDGDRITLDMHGRRPRAVNLTTAPHPAFPTDMQAQFMAMNCIAEGVGVINETIFENRFMHVQELLRLGADIRVDGHTAIVRGVEKLSGAPVMATDLRASASLILAGLVADGETIIDRIYHLDRGYENIEAKLSGLGREDPPDRLIAMHRQYKKAPHAGLFVLRSMHRLQLQVDLVLAVLALQDARRHRHASTTQTMVCLSPSLRTDLGRLLRLPPTVIVSLPATW